PTPEPVSPAIKVYPNPFKPSEGHTEITFTNLPSGASVRIFHMEGRIIATLEEAAGEAKWNVEDNGGDKISSGLYLYRVESSKGNQTGKVVIIR
ncbi:MAG: T9SS type A sorting domain-containing protein, partial [bacterium]